MHSVKKNSGRVTVFNATFRNILNVFLSWRSVLFVEETGTRKNRRPSASHWQTLSHYVVSHTRILNTKITELFSIRLWNLLHVHVFFLFCKIIQSQIDLFSNKHNVHRPNSNCTWNTYLRIIYKQRIALTIRSIWCPYFSYLINIGSSNADIMFLSFSTLCFWVIQRKMWRIMLNEQTFWFP
jgi:hypothetical protein